jgi:hypothetical protein
VRLVERDEDGLALLRAAEQRSLQGVVSKPRESPTARANAAIGARSRRPRGERRTERDGASSSGLRRGPGLDTAAQCEVLTMSDGGNVPRYAVADAPQLQLACCPGSITAAETMNWYSCASASFGPLAIIASPPASSAAICMLRATIGCSPFGWPSVTPHARLRGVCAPSAGACRSPTRLRSR